MNLVFGMCSILSTVEGHLDWGAIFIFCALVADGLDGRIARAFGVSSEFGKEMDSLCDLGSFGVAPAILAWTLALHNYGFLGIAVTIFFAVCGMWRLTRFNVNASVVHGYFMGLAIPAGGNLVALNGCCREAQSFGRALNTHSRYHHFAERFGIFSDVNGSKTLVGCSLCKTKLPCRIFVSNAACSEYVVSARHVWNGKTTLGVGYGTF